MVEAHAVHPRGEAENGAQRLGMALPETGLIIHVDHTRGRSKGETLELVNGTEGARVNPLLSLKDEAVQ